MGGCWGYTFLRVLGNRLSLLEKKTCCCYDFGVVSSLFNMDERWSIVILLLRMIESFVLKTFRCKLIWIYRFVTLRKRMILMRLLPITTTTACIETFSKIIPETLISLNYALLNWLWLGTSFDAAPCNRCILISTNKIPRMLTFLTVLQLLLLHKLV